jgi:DNA-binding SARP family transcriptional activator/tetratricopeptide (TPR) repeat protein
MATLTVRLLGSPEITVNQRSLSFRTRKALALLIYLVIERGMHSREALMALLWPQSSSKNAAVTLRGTLSRLRRALQPAGDVLLSEMGKVGFDFSHSVDLDLAWLAAAALPEASPDELDAILNLDRGEFLAGFSLPDAPGFDTWAAIQREACQRQVESVYDRLTQRQLSHHEINAAVASAARWVARVPLSEAAYRRLMAGQALAGDRPAALQTFAQCRAMLQEEFGIQPARETDVLAENISHERLSVGPGEAAAGPALVTPPRPGRRELRLPFEGRAEEHSQLAAAFHQASQGDAHVGALIGAAGVGKTRLLDAFQEWAVLEAPGVEIWRGRAFEMGGHLPYQAIIEALRLRLEQENAPEDLLEDVWLAELSQLMPELRARYPDLPAPMTGDASFVRARLFSAVATLGSALAARHPAILLLDDMQWADADMRDMVHYLARRWAESGTPILVLLSIRQESFAADAPLREWLGQLGRDVPLTRLLIDTLSGTAVRQLVRRLAAPDADQEVSNEFGEWLWAETGGLPFFIEALLQMLAERGILTVKETDGHFGYDYSSALAQVKSSGQVAVPPGVREAILARLERLPEEAAALLLAAAVLGRESRFETLSRIADIAEADALKAITTLLNGRFLMENQAARRPYTPAHDYIREVVYSASHAAQRRVFHRRALIALEAERASAAECAYHAIASLLDEPALRFSLAAGDEALRACAMDECLAHYDRAREAARRMLDAGTAIDSQSLLGLYRNRGRALEVAEDYPAAMENYQEMLELGTAREDRALEAAALTAMCVIHTSLTPFFNIERAKEFGQAALELSRRLEDREAEAGALWGMMQAEIHSSNADGQRVMAYGEQSLSITRQLGLKELQGNVLINLCWPYFAQKQVKAARQANLEALDIWRALGNIPRLLDTYGTQEWILNGVGDNEGGLAAASEALRLGRSIGNRSAQNMALFFTVAIQAIQGQFGQALANLKVAMALSEEAGDPFSKPSAYALLQSIYLYAGALDQAEGWADKLYALRESMMAVSKTRYLTGIVRVKTACGKLDLARAILDQLLEGFNWNSSWSHEITSIAIADGYLQLAMGRPERVFTRWQDRVRQFRAAGFHRDLATEMWLRGKARLALEDVDQAKDALLEARAVAVEKGERTILWQILATLSELEGGYGDREAAKKLYEQAREVIEYIAENAGELRDSFLAQPAVAAVLAEHQA